MARAASAGSSRFHAVLLSALRPYEEVRPALPHFPYVFANPGSDPGHQFHGRLGSRSVHELVRDNWTPWRSPAARRNTASASLSSNSTVQQTRSKARPGGTSPPGPPRGGRE
jgi:hypothetical protein